MKRRVSAIILALCLALTLMPNIAFAEGGAGPDTSWYNADATEFTLSDAADLLGFAELVNNGTTTFLGKTVKLTANIDLTGIAWTPIGKVDKYGDQENERTFEGTFDGQNHTISNLTCTGSVEAGFFGSLCAAKVKNLTLANVTITSNHYAGGIAAFTSDDSSLLLIENCKVSGGTIKSVPESDGTGYDNGDKAGGIIGYTSTQGTIKNCTVENVTIEGYRDLGAIVGYQNSGTVDDNCTVTDVTIKVDFTHNYKGYTSINQALTKAVGNDASGVTVKVVNPVAEVNGKGYATLQDAVNAAQNGQTVKVLKDIVIDIPTDSLNGRFYYCTITNKTLTIDLNGKTISWCEAAKTQTGGDWDVVFALVNGANVTITGNGTVDGRNVGNHNGCTAWLRKPDTLDAPSKLTIKNGTFYGETILYANTGCGEITIEGGYFSDPSYDGHCQIFNVQGYLAFGAGNNITMTGGTLDCRDPRYLNDGNAVAEGYVVCKVTKADGKRDYSVIPASEAVGYYNAKTADYDWNHDNNKQAWKNKYGVDFPAESQFAFTAEDAAAKIGNTYYRTLYSAVYDSNPGDTVTVIKDIEIGLNDMYSIPNYNTSVWVYVQDASLSKDLTLDLNGHTIKLAEDAKNASGTHCYRLFNLAYGSKLTVTGNGTIDGTCAGQNYTYIFAMQQDQNAQLTIENGTYCAEEIVASYGQNTCVINGGTFTLPQNMIEAGTNLDQYLKHLLNNQYGKNIAFKIRGGTFIGVDPSRMDDGNLVDDGYIVKKDDSKYTVVPKSSLTSGVYTSDPTGFLSSGYYISSADTVNGLWTVSRYSSSSSSSSSSSASKYNVTVENANNGSAAADRKSAAKGTTVTITVTPDEGYTLETLTITDKNGKKIELTDKGNGKYTFQMPAGAVTVNTTFAEDNTLSNSFVDVPANAYYYDAVLWAANKGITGGVDENHFAPDSPCTRAQIVTFLWRAAGSPEPTTQSSFSDVPAGAYYVKAVAWAVENGITTGVTADTFCPDQTCTRAQAVAFLFRYAASQGMDAVTLQELVSVYGDAAQVPGYALSAFNWALANGVVTGNNGDLMPNNDCTRAQIVTMLYRLLNT